MGTIVDTSKILQKEILPTPTEFCGRHHNSVLEISIMSEYDSVQGGGLRLKGVKDGGIKKKKKKSKEKKGDNSFEQGVSSSDGGNSSSSTLPAKFRLQIDKRTKAEIAFDDAKEKKDAELILKKAAKSHKERILEFNEHLDSLSEHFDIPKVSWT